MPRKKKQTPPIEETPVPVPAPEPTELELIESEMRSLSPTLPELKKTNQDGYERAYKRYLWLVARREELKGGG